MTQCFKSSFLSSAFRKRLGQRLGLARAFVRLFVEVLAGGFFEVEGGVAQTRGEPVEGDSGLASLARPARAVEHGERHRQRVMLAGAVARELELTVEPVDEADRLFGRLHVLEAELAREELRGDVLRLRSRGVEVEVARME